MALPSSTTSEPQEPDSRKKWRQQDIFSWARTKEPDDQNNARNNREEKPFDENMDNIQIDQNLGKCMVDSSDDIQTYNNQAVFQKDPNPIEIHGAYEDHLPYNSEYFEKGMQTLQEPQRNYLSSFQGSILPNEASYYNQEVRGNTQGIPFFQGTQGSPLYNGIQEVPIYDQGVQGQPLYNQGVQGMSSYYQQGPQNITEHPWYESNLQLLQEIYYNQSLEPLGDPIKYFNLDNGNLDTESSMYFYNSLPGHPIDTLPKFAPSENTIVHIHSEDSDNGIDVLGNTRGQDSCVLNSQAGLADQGVPQMKTMSQQVHMPQHGIQQVQNATLEEENQETSKVQKIPQEQSKSPPQSIKEQVSGATFKSIHHTNDIAPSKQLDWRSVLSGNRKKKPKKQKEGTVKTKTGRLDSLNKHFKHEHDVVELERKLHKNAAGVSAKEILGKKKPEKRDLEDEDTAIIIQESEPPKNSKKIPVDSNTVLVLSDDSDELETRVFHQAKKASAMDLLRGPRKNKVEASQPPSKWVTLRIASEMLCKIETKKKVPLVKGTQSQGKSAFEMMMSHSNKATIKLTPLQKMKELQPPTLRADEFHVTGETAEKAHGEEALTDSAGTQSKKIVVESGRAGSKRISDNIILKRKESQTLLEEETSSFLSPITPSAPTSPTYTFSNSSADPIALARSIPLSAPIKAIVDRMLVQKEPTKHMLWTQAFAPRNIKETLLHEPYKDRICNWIGNSFEKLKQALQKPRNVLLKEQRRLQQQLGSLDGFIVDDIECEDVHVPLLILQGASGSFKTAAIYSVMKQMNGYVHEINSGSNRGRKEIYSSLKEFCTTQLVHKQQESKTFQRGIVLIEDTDVLFEQDKTFWSVIQDLINITRRPIVLTCEDTQNIPRSLLRHSECVILDESVEIKDIEDYLWVCGLSQGFDIDRGVIRSTFGPRPDLRKSLMELQAICAGRQQDGLVTVQMKSANVSVMDKSLEELSSELDLFSCADVIQEKTVSQLLHHSQENEFIDVYYIDTSTHLTQKPLPFEVNIGEYLAGRMDNKAPSASHSINQLRDLTSGFVGSRRRKKNWLRTMRYDSEESTGVPESSCLKHTPTNDFILDIMPTAREWSRFQHSIDIFMRKDKNVKAFLKYRDFTREPELERTI